MQSPRRAPVCCVCKKARTFVAGASMSPAPTTTPPTARDCPCLFSYMYTTPLFSLRARARGGRKPS